MVGPLSHQRVSGGKVLSRRTKACANRAATALRRAASGLHHRLISTMLKHGTAYVRQGRDEYAQPYHVRRVKHMARRAKARGSTLVKAPEGNPA